MFNFVAQAVNIPSETSSGMPIMFAVIPVTIFVLALVFILSTVILNLRRNRWSKFINAPSLQLENLELMNKLLKQKLEKGEGLTSEEMGMMKEMNKSSKI